LGYTPFTISPTPVDENHCLWRREGATAYAYTVPLALLQTRYEPLGAALTIPIRDYTRQADTITVDVTTPNEDTVLVVQENAYPGWRVTVNGDSAELESVGGLVGVVLPANGSYRVEFKYRPPLLMVGAVISALTAIALG